MRHNVILPSFAFTEKKKMEKIWVKNCFLYTQSIFVKIDESSGNARNKTKGQLISE